MVMTNHSWEEQTRRLLSQARSELNEIEVKIDEMKDKATNLVVEISGYEIALKGYLLRTGREGATKPEWVKLLEGQTHREKLVTIAKQMGGKVRVSQATDILYTNKLTQSKKRATAYSIVQVHLTDMAEEGIFKKVGAGEYKLLSAQQGLPGVS